MFDAIAKGFRQAKNRLAGLTELTESNIDTALREVRLSLLEADVELGVVKTFLARVKDKALGEVVRIKAKGQGGEAMKVSAADQFVKICHDELVDFMTAEGPALMFAEKGAGPTDIMMVGLQGSGKTTTHREARALSSRRRTTSRCSSPPTCSARPPSSRLAHRAAGAVRAEWDGRGGARPDRGGGAHLDAPRDGGGVTGGA